MMFKMFIYKTVFLGLFLVEQICGQSTLYDLTVNLGNGTLRWPSHHEFISTLTDRGPWGNLNWLANEYFVSGTHVGTHMDSPLHFNTNGWSIDEIPIERFVEVPAVFIDIRYKSLVDPDVNITVDDVLEFEENHGTIPDGSVVFQCSGWSDFFDNEKLLFGNDIQNTSDFHFPGFEQDAAQWLVENRGIIAIGVDTPSLDYGQTVTFATHIYTAAQNVYGLEFVKDTCNPPPNGATAYIFPSKLRRLSGASTRVIVRVGPEETDAGSANKAPVVNILFTVILSVCIHI